MMLRVRSSTTLIMKTSSFLRVQRSAICSRKICARPGSASPSNDERPLNRLVDRLGEATNTDVSKGGVPIFNRIGLNRGLGERGGLRSPEERRRRVSIL